MTIRVQKKLRWMKLAGHRGEVFMCVWNPLTYQLASGSADGMCRVWNLIELDEDQWHDKDKEKPIRTAIMPHSQYVGEKFKDVTSVTWSPDGRRLATGCYDGTARLWNYDGSLVSELREHNGPVFSLKWSKDGERLLSGSYDKRAIVWDVKTGTVIKTFSLHDAPVLDVDWKDSDTFATCSSDKTIHICNVSSVGSSSTRQLLKHKDEVNAVCWSPNGELLASCSDDWTAKIWNPNDTSEDSLKFDLVGHAKEIYTVRWTPTGPGSTNPDKHLKLCTASFDGSVCIWDGTTGKLIHSLRRYGEPVYSIAPSPSGDMLATGSLGGYVTVWNMDDGSLERELRGNGDTFDVSWSKDGKLLSSCFSCGNLQILDMTTKLDAEDLEELSLIKTNVNGDNDKNSSGSHEKSRSNSTSGMHSSPSNSHEKGRSSSTGGMSGSPGSKLAVKHGSGGTAVSGGLVQPPVPSPLASDSALVNDIPPPPSSLKTPSHNNNSNTTGTTSSTSIGGGEKRKSDMMTSDTDNNDREEPPLKSSYGFSGSNTNGSAITASNVAEVSGTVSTEEAPPSAASPSNDNNTEMDIQFQ